MGRKIVTEADRKISDLLSEIKDLKDVRAALRAEVVFARDRLHKQLVSRDDFIRIDDLLRRTA